MFHQGSNPTEDVSCPHCNGFFVQAVKDHPNPFIPPNHHHGLVVFCVPERGNPVEYFSGVARTAESLE